MIAEIVSIGTELLLGQIVDTNSAFLSERLAAVGVDLYHKTVVGDNIRRIEDILKLAVSRSDIVITSGGLGPTEDDCTKEAVSSITSSPLEFDKASLEHIRKIFSSRNSEMPKNNEVQAMFPRGSKIFSNPRGTAPGFAVEFNGKVIVSLPGPPREFKPMVDEKVIPYICSRLKSSGVIKSKILKIVGISESKLSEILRDIFMSSSNPTLAYLAGEKGITLRITAKGKDREEADVLISKMEKQVRERIDKLIFGTDDDTLEGVVGKMLREKRLTLAIAESCTGGLVSDRITDVPGSSEYYMLGAITYSNRAKSEVLKIPEEMMNRCGAVSKEVAQAMAEGIREISGTDIGIAVTGIAGPSGGTPEKPVGLVYIALSSKNKSYYREYRFGGERLRNKSFTAYMAIEMLRRYLLGYLDEE